jgi:hypothetical protein
MPIQLENLILKKSGLTRLVAPPPPSVLLGPIIPIRYLWCKNHKMHVDIQSNKSLWYAIYIVIAKKYAQKSDFPDSPS